jgi:hypothetical protein
MHQINHYHLLTAINVEVTKTGIFHPRNKSNHHADNIILECIIDFMQNTHIHSYLLQSVSLFFPSL